MRADDAYLRGLVDHLAQHIDDAQAEHEQRQRRRAQKAESERRRCFELRAELVAKLGGACVGCGTGERLEFDHLKRRTWKSAHLTRWSRLLRYQREIARGLIELRCRSCNARKGRPS